MKLLPVLTTISLFVPMAHAQERTAGGALETQMTWTALKALVTDANSKSGAAHTRIDQIEKCAKKNMLYAAGKGCIAITVPSQPTIPDCGKQNKVFDGVKCVDPLAVLNVCAAQGKLYNPATKTCVHVSGRSTCPAGYKLIGEAGTFEAYCISTKPESSKYWIDAVANCYNKSPKAHLCSAEEWATACTAGISNMKRNGYEWVAGVVGNKYGASLIGGSTCGGDLSNAANPYQAESRCCFK